MVRWRQWHGGLRPEHAVNRRGEQASLTINELPQLHAPIAAVLDALPLLAQCVLKSLFARALLSGVVCFLRRLFLLTHEVLYLRAFSITQSSQIHTTPLTHELRPPSPVTRVHIQQRIQCIVV